MAGERCPCCETCACCGCNAADLLARLALAEAVIEAADALTVDVRTLRAQAASEAYDKARDALQAFDRAANAEAERGTPAPEPPCGCNEYGVCGNCGPAPASR